MEGSNSKKQKLQNILAGSEELSYMNFDDEDTSGVYTLETLDGNSIDGKMISSDSVSMTFKTLSGIEMKSSPGFNQINEPDKRRSG